MTTICYLCEKSLGVVFNEKTGVLESASSNAYFCSNCHRWMCDNTSECGCVCSITDDDLYSDITGDASTFEVVEMGLDALKNEITGIWNEVDMNGFQIKYMPHLTTDSEKIDRLTLTIYEYAVREEIA